ncbi:hypothetical protein L3X38_027386 [Prunus dulcis]|uniref:Transposable element protein n=1 Tax=Prunus dulcis TaxID=3755 RepID=A0AAD4VMQ6_PRUDU|nr:hypothetical protein L3X38_027386 [Prunus dulcis]
MSTFPASQWHRKDATSLPNGSLSSKAEIDKLLATGFIEELLSFMDAYSGYNQILMHEDNKAKTSFII